MPPWPAERGYGAFANDGALTPRQIEFLMTWIDGGVPMGEGDLVPYFDHRVHWMLGPPTHIVTPRSGDPAREGGGRIDKAGARSEVCD